MKILIVNTSGIGGGAARAAYRLHLALLNEGVDSQMLVRIKSNDDFTVIAKEGKVNKVISLLRPTLDQLPVKFYKERTKTLFSPAWLPFGGIVDMINKLNPDIVHLHWICGGMIRIEDLEKIKAPIVWSLHDNWAFTGGCHIMWECERYKESCGRCPRLGSDEERDLSSWIYSRKNKIFSNIKNMTIVGLSKWITKASNESTLLKDKKHINLPNPLDTTLFKPLEKNSARELWKLPKDKKLILFGAMSATSDINKGFKELTQALKFIKDKSDIELVVFGSLAPKNATEFGYKTHYLGHLHDDMSLVTLYSACDVMVVPSLQESFGQVASESMSCMLPVVAFNTTGLKDIINHKINGYLAKPYDVIDLAYGIEWVLYHDNYITLSKKAREKVVKEFDSRVVAKKYINLYEEILNAK